MNRQNIATCLTFLLAIIFFPSISKAQNFLPLESIIDQVAEQYVPTRCAALYQSVLEWGGQTRLGEDLWNRTMADRDLMVFVAADLMHSLSGTSAEQSTTAVARDIRNIADIYLERMEHNYAAQGQAFGSDELFTQDFNLCKTYADMLRQP